MNKMIAEIQERLTSKGEPATVAFFDKMVPGTQKVYGVKTPELNLIAKEFSTGGFELVETLWQSGSLEEKIIAIKILERIGGKDVTRTLNLVKKFSNSIDNWAVCDGLGMQALKGVRKSGSDEIFAQAEKYSHSKNPWQRRLSLVMVEWYTRIPGHHPKIKKLIKSLENDDEYYVKKAIQWINKNFKKGK